MTCPRPTWSAYHIGPPRSAGQLEPLTQMTSMSPGPRLRVRTVLLRKLGCPLQSFLAGRILNDGVDEPIGTFGNNLHLSANRFQFKEGRPRPAIHHARALVAVAKLG